MLCEEIMSNFKGLLDSNPCWFVVRGDRTINNPVEMIRGAMNQGGLEKLEEEERFWYIWKYYDCKIKAWYGDDLEEVPMEEIKIT